MMLADQSIATNIFEDDPAAGKALSLTDLLSMKERESEVLAGPSTTNDRDEDFESHVTMESYMSQVDISDATLAQSSTNFNFSNCNVTITNQKKPVNIVLLLLYSCAFVLLLLYTS